MTISQHLQIAVITKLQLEYYGVFGENKLLTICKDAL